MTDIIINTEQGLVRGIICKDYKNGLYYSFYGIPYAKPPLGNLRFKSPQPPDNWSGIRDGTVEREGCISRHTITSKIVGTEDCLFLNVYTTQLPNSNNNSLKPVLVWIHGGAYANGSAGTELFGPDFLITEDVIIVTISYRLGFLGYLHLDDPSLGVPGNAALRDVIMALKWIRNNIKSFMGDPENVTMFGQSSGGVSIHFIMLSPLGKGLFHKSIMHSGSALMLWARGKKGGARKLSEALGCNATDEKEILHFLQGVPAMELFQGREKIKNPISANILRHFLPVIENSDSLEPPVISEESLETILKGTYNKMPMIMGYANHEGIFFEVSLKNTKIIVKNFEHIIPHTLNLKPGSHISKLTAQKIKDFYFGNEKPTIENKEKYLTMQGDNFFICRVPATIKYHLKNNPYPMYLYRFSVDADLNMYKKLCKSSIPGANHTDDVCYLFKMSISPKVLPGSVEEKTIMRMTKLWSNFARYGDPNPTKENDLINVHWKPVENGLLHFLDIGNELTVGINPDATRTLFWDELYNLDPVLAKL